MEYYKRILFEITAPSSISDLSRYFTCSLELQTDLKSTYSLTSHIKSKDHYICLIDDILIDDLNQYAINHPYQWEYKRAVEKYGADVMNLWVVDKETMKKKLTSFSECCINEYLLSSENADVVRIDFHRYAPDGFKSGVADIIYEVIQENFNIVKQNLFGNKKSIYIKKRSY